MSLNTNTIKAIFKRITVPERQEWLATGINGMEMHSERMIKMSLTSLAEPCCDEPRSTSHYEKGLMIGMMTGVALCKLSLAGTLEKFYEDWQENAKKSRGENVVKLENKK